MTGKLQVIDGKETNWCGLWWNPDNNSFKSQSLNLSELHKFKGKVRLIVRKNKFFNNGENNRPNYNFILRDANADTAFELQVNDIADYARAPYYEDGFYYDGDGNRLYTSTDVRAIINGTFYDARSGVGDPYDILPEDFV